MHINREHAIDTKESMLHRQSKDEEEEEAQGASIFESRSLGVNEKAKRQQQ